MQLGIRLFVAAICFSVAACRLPFSEDFPVFPSISGEHHGELMFVAGHSSQMEQVLIEVTAGASDLHVAAIVSIDTAGVDGQRPVVLTVTNSDGESINDFLPDYAGEVPTVVGSFGVFDCPAKQTCAATFNLTFRRITSDTRPHLASDWFVRVTGEYQGLDPRASVPPGGSISITITT